MTKFSEFSVKNSLFVNCLALFFIVAGILAIIRIPREIFPNVDFDIVTVRTNYTGASPEQVERLITIPIEENLKEVDGIKEFNSISVDSTSIIILEIEPDEPNKDRIVTDIQRAVERITDFPDDLEELPVVTEMKTRDNPIVEVSLSGNLPEETIRQLAENLETEFENLKDVSDIALKGFRDQEIWVEVDPGKMAQLEVSLPLIIQALKKRNVGVPGGRMTLGAKEFLLRTTGEFETPGEIEEVIVRANDEGHWVQIKDIASVKSSLAEEKITNHTNGTRSINLVVIKRANGNALTLIKKIKDVAHRFKEKAPAELNINFVNDMTYYLERRLNVLKSNGAIGFVLVFILLFFVLSPRIAAGAAIGMPTAILAAFVFMRFFGISINLLSMFGMIMVIGMLVDEDIVIAENVFRHMEEGKSPLRAAIEGTLEVTKPLLATVLTTLVAFLPLVMMKGIIGKFVRDIPIVVSIVLIASLLEALIILPSHISDFNRGYKRDPNKKRKIEIWTNQLIGAYGRSLRWCLAKKHWVIGVGSLFTIASIFYAIFGMNFILFPAKGVEVFFIRAEAEVGTPLETMTSLIKPLEELVTTLPEEELDSYVTQIGIIQQDPHDPFTSRGSHLAQIAVFLTPNSRRDRSAQEIMEDLRSRHKKAADLTRIDFDEVKPGPPTGKPVAIQIRGKDVPTLMAIAEKYKTYLKSLPGVRNIDDDFERGKDEMRVVIDEKRASQAQLSIASIAASVRHAFEGTIATVIRKADEKIDVIVRLPIELRQDKTVLENLLVENTYGLMIPLKEVAHFETEPSIAAVKHLEAERLITVTANIDEKITTSQVVNTKLSKDFKDLLINYPGYTIKYGGEQEDTNESLKSLQDAFIIAFLLILLILLVTFRSILDSTIILLTIPYGVVGVAAGLTLHGQPFSFMALLGMVGLSGIVVDNGILMIDFIRRQHKETIASDEAIIEGAKIRFRPIVLVTLSTVFGVIPTVYGIGGNDPFIQPMALALNYGLTVSAILTLFMIPCALSIASDFRHWLLKHFSWIRLTNNNY
ncbi:MAG: hypothetical protein A3F89_01820 [Deltaproteobacteria bacterium RIFCSPLOWO2_12_FULL_50_11]|nr:MAG: hypothetical protein A3F89_01820 [Deltaproteobacteria bacterium RIFCSPLOWO2_12_FULL_50_11]